MSERINQNVSNDIQIVFDGNKFSNDSYNIIQQISAILESNKIDEGEFEIDIFKIKVNRVMRIIFQKLRQIEIEDLNFGALVQYQKK